MSRSAPAADDTPISAAETAWLFAGFGPFPAFVLAVSGGPDSTALMVLAARWRGNGKTPRLVAVTVDHGLRKESKREAKMVERLAHKLGIEHRTVRWTGRKPKTGLQAAARIARYRLLSDVAKEVGADHVVTAHTADDQAETILMRLSRGSGVQGLCGMLEIGGIPIFPPPAMLVRPLLDVPKSRLIATLKAARISYVDDPSNRNPDFTRSRLRQLMPLLAGEGLTPARLALLAKRMQRVEEILGYALARANTDVVIDDRSIYQRMRAQGEDEPILLRTREFSKLPDEIAIRLLDWTISKVGKGDPQLGKLERFHNSMHEILSVYSESPETEAILRFKPFRRTLAGALVTVARDKITIEKAPPRRAGLGAPRGAGKSGLTKARRVPRKRSKPR